MAQCPGLKPGSIEFFTKYKVLVDYLLLFIHGLADIAPEFAKYYHSPAVIITEERFHAWCREEIAKRSNLNERSVSRVVVEEPKPVKKRQIAISVLLYLESDILSADIQANENNLVLGCCEWIKDSVKNLRI